MFPLGLLKHSLWSLQTTGPAITIAGMAITNPYNNVSPIPAPNCVTNAVGDGMRRQKPMGNR